MAIFVNGTITSFLGPDGSAFRDGPIAATAITHELTLVTRNTRDFDDLPLPLINPRG